MVAYYVELYKLSSKVDPIERQKRSMNRWSRVEGGRGLLS